MKATTSRSETVDVRHAVSPFGVQSDGARQLLGVSLDVLHKIPFTVLPYLRLGTHRWYLVRHLELLAERLIALRIARGAPKHMESLHELLRDLPTMDYAQ